MNQQSAPLREIGQAFVYFLVAALLAVQVSSTLASTFASGNGIVTTDFSGSKLDAGRNVIVQPDGRIIVGGTSDQSGTALARYNMDGSLDTTFGVAGRVVGSIIGDQSLALQLDGGILIAGGFNNNHNVSNFVVARYTRNGVLDSTFGNLGLVTTGFDSKGDIASSITVQPDGKIVVSGRSDMSSSFLFIDNDFALVRYMPDGRLDLSFGSGGKVTTAFGSNRNDRSNSVTVQQDGKILVAGSSAGIIGSDFALARYNSDGSLDARFGANGKVSASRGSVWSVKVQPDGKIVAVGYTDGFEFAALRYETNGAPDFTFGTAGKVTTKFGLSSFDFAYAAVIQHDGKIVVA